MNRYCLLVPHYNHSRQLLGFLPRLLAAGLPCVIVDDGSRPEELAAVQAAVADDSRIHFFALGANRGKGAAVKAGFTLARPLGFTHAIQIDADGQHAVEDLPRFIAASDADPRAIICGRPVFDESAPRARRYGRKVTDVFVALETLSLGIKDSLCGFRVYPLTAMERVLDNHFVGSRMDFDPELLVKAAWRGIPMAFLDTRVIYPEQSVSHFNYLRDNLTMIRLHTRLLLTLPVHVPGMLWRRLRSPAAGTPPVP